LILFIDLIADVRLAFERRPMFLETRALRDGDRREKAEPEYLSLTYFMNSKNEEHSPCIGWASMPPRSSSQA